MDPFVAGSLIGAGSSLFGGIVGAINQDRAQKQEYERQKEFAQNSIGWRVADAKRSGLHPLAAIGMNSTSYTPLSTAGDPLQEGLTNAGQAIQSGIADRQAQMLQMKQLDLQNKKVQAEIAYLNRLGQSPSNTASQDNKSKPVTQKKISPPANLNANKVVNEKGKTDNNFTSIIENYQGYYKAYGSANKMNLYPNDQLTDTVEAGGNFGKFGLKMDQIYDGKQNAFEFLSYIAKKDKSLNDGKNHYYSITRHATGLGITIERVKHAPLADVIIVNGRAVKTRRF